MYGTIKSVFFVAYVHVDTGTSTSNSTCIVMCTKDYLKVVLLQFKVSTQFST